MYLSYLKNLNFLFKFLFSMWLWAQYFGPSQGIEMEGVKVHADSTCYLYVIFCKLPLCFPDTGSTIFFAPFSLWSQFS